MAEEAGVPDRSHRERRLCPGPGQTLAFVGVSVDGSARGQTECGLRTARYPGRVRATRGARRKVPAHRAKSVELRGSISPSLAEPSAAAATPARWGPDA